MNILIAPNSFKESLDAKEVAENLEKGIKMANHLINTFKLPVSDGGDGILNRLISSTGGRYFYTKATGPLGDKINTRYGVLGDKKTAVIESSLICGINLVPVDKRDPTKTTSYGLGELIQKTMNKGYKTIILGLGGSATNDGGAGMAQALGLSLRDRYSKEIPFGGINLLDLSHIDASNLEKKLKEVDITVACNPTSLLCGPKGTSLKYSIQKGATENQAKALEEALNNYGLKLSNFYGEDIRYYPGSGGAGGIGASLLTFLNANLKPHIEVIKKYIPIEEKVRDSDIVITAEGKFDETSCNKITGELSKLSKIYKKSIIGICGQISNIKKLGPLFDSTYCISMGPSTLKQAMLNTKIGLFYAGYNIAKILSIR